MRLISYERAFCASLFILFRRTVPYKAHGGSLPTAAARLDQVDSLEAQLLVLERQMAGKAKQHSFSGADCCWVLCRDLKRLVMWYQGRRRAMAPAAASRLVVNQRSLWTDSPRWQQNPLRRF